MIWYVPITADACPVKCSELGAAWHVALESPEQLNLLEPRSSRLNTDSTPLARQVLPSVVVG